MAALCVSKLCLLLREAPIVLEIQLAVDAEVAVGAGERVADARANGGDAVIVLVVRLEVSSTEL